MPGVALGGPIGGHYWLMAARDDRELSETEAASILQQYMVPRRDYNLGFTVTPGYVPHRSKTVQLDPQYKVTGIIPFHTWD
jgi:hypothetical protein